MIVTEPTRASIRRRAAVVALVALAGLALSAGVAGAQSSGSVEVVDNSFVPESVTVGEGGTVTWTQTGSNPHTITADDGSFDSHPDCPPDFANCMSNGDTFSMTFEQAGEYPYYCKIHGDAGGVGMSGVVVVEAAQAEEPTEEPTGEPAPEEPTDEPATEPTEEAAPEEGAEGELAATGLDAGTAALLIALAIVLLLGGSFLVSGRARRVTS